MTTGYTDCPYCEKEIKIDYDGVKQGEIFLETCDHCDKKFNCYYELSIDFYCSKIEEKKQDDN